MIGFVVSRPFAAVTVEFCDDRSEPTIARIRFGRYAVSRPSGNSGPSAGDVATLQRDFERFLDGDLRDLAHMPVLLEGFTAFRRDVLRAARAIPWGSVVSYAQLARMAGHGGATRAAATAMRTNPYPLVVPCHRVVHADGTVGGFMGHDTGRAVALKLRLLRHEGVTVAGAGSRREGCLSVPKHALTVR